MLVTRDQFAIQACTWIGVPFLHQGRSRAGIDCFGILTESARAIGASDYDVTGYGRRPPPEWIQKGLLEHLQPSDDYDRVGSILVFGFGKKKTMQHFAVRTHYGMVHTNASLGKCHHHDLSPQWLDRLVSVWDLPGISD